MTNVIPHDPGDAALMVYTPEEYEAFWKLVSDMPQHGPDETGQVVPCSCGPHSFKHIRKVCEIVKPTLMLEIGFNLGWSASMWLGSSDTKLVSVDISTRKNTALAAEKLKEKYPDRFEFISSDSKSVLPMLLERGYQFSLVFIDGDHTHQGVENDVQVALALKSPYIFFDDWIPRFGPGTIPAIKKHKLEIIEQMGNMVLTKPPVKS